MDEPRPARSVSVSLRQRLATVVDNNFGLHDHSDPRTAAVRDRCVVAPGVVAAANVACACLFLAQMRRRMTALPKIPTPLNAQAMAAAAAAAPHAPLHLTVVEVCGTAVSTRVVATEAQFTELLAAIAPLVTQHEAWMQELHGAGRAANTANTTDAGAATAAVAAPGRAPGAVGKPARVRQRSLNVPLLADGDDGDDGDDTLGPGDSVSMVGGHFPGPPQPPPLPGLRHPHLLRHRLSGFFGGPGSAVGSLHGGSQAGGGAEPLLWVQVSMSDHAALKRLAAAAHLPAEAVASALVAPQRPRLEELGANGALGAILRGLRLRPDCDDGPTATPGLDDAQLAVFVCTPRLVVTLQMHRAPDPVVAHVMARLAMPTVLVTYAVDAFFVFYALAHSIVNGFFPVLESLGDRLQDLEQAILDNPAPSSIQQARACTASRPGGAPFGH